MTEHRIASIPADGIGPEVISAGLEVLDAVAARDGGFTLKIAHYDWGSNYYRKHGHFMPADAMAWLRTADAIYFGAVGDPNIPDDVTHAGGCGCRSARGLTSMPMCARRASWPGITLAALREVPGPRDLPTG